MRYTRHSSIWYQGYVRDRVAPPCPKRKTALNARNGLKVLIIMLVAAFIIVLFKWMKMMIVMMVMVVVLVMNDYEVFMSAEHSRF